MNYKSKILITLGGTKEKIDPVRFISNESSGMMGYEIIKALLDFNYEIIVVLGTNSLSFDEIDFLQKNCFLIEKIETALEMQKAVMLSIANHKPEIYISVSAVSDFRPKIHSETKIKKENLDEIIITLVKNPDILREVANLQNNRPKIVVGFAVEDENVLEDNIINKLYNKNLDIIIGNNTNAIGNLQNQVTIFNRNGEKFQSKILDKKEIGRIITKYIDDFYKKAHCI